VEDGHSSLRVLIDHEVDVCAKQDHDEARDEDPEIEDGETEDEKPEPRKLDPVEAHARSSFSAR